MRAFRGQLLAVGLSLPTLVAADIGKCEGVQKELQPCDLDECSGHECMDCVWSPWGEYGPCDCGGLQERHRTITQQNNDCGKPCEGAKVETRECEAPCHKPPQDCVLSDWSDWASCDQKCGGGQTFRSRTIVKEQSHGGDTCKGLLKETKACNTTPCNVKTDCLLSEWGAWEECTKSCEGGQQTRKRTIDVPAKFGGKPCTDPLVEMRGCNEQTCGQGIDCEWGEWEAWSACSKTCNGGEKARSRLITVAPRNGGKLCDVNDMAEVASCNTDPCDSPVDCQMSEWSGWDDCSCSCNGIHQRARFISQYPAKNGTPCDGALKEIQACNIEACFPQETTEAPPQNCALGEWSNWSMCTVTCGGGQMNRSRQIAQMPKYGGEVCMGDLKEVKGCNVQACVDEPVEHTEKDCEWSEWDAWGACSVSCGGGQKVRQRQITAMANMWGKPCDHKASMEVAQCNVQPCDSTDCVWGEWSEWGAATCTGLCERHRSIVQHQSGIGKPCVGAKVSTKRCQPDCAKPPQNCELSEWDDWSQCTVACGGGQTYRTRGILQEAKHGGDTCEDKVMKETKPCNEQKCGEIVDCVLGTWDEWTACSATCGGGQQFRHRAIDTHASSGGKPCTDELSEVRGCGEGPCENQVDCVWGEWSAFGACSASCGGGMKFRDRSIAIAPRNGGKLCEAKSKTEVVACNTESCGSGCTDGVWAEWGSYSECSAACGGGYQVRSRKIAITPNECGAELEGPEQEFQKCNTQSCEQEVVDCQFSEWSEFGDCSCPCNGIKDRTRRIVQYAQGGGALCEGALKEVHACNRPGHGSDCGTSPVDCVLSEWESWGECTAPCGGGTQRRTRNVLTPPSGNGVPCEGCLDEIRGCNEQACESVVNCQWGQWHDWGACSKPCGGGQRSRFRHITTMPKNGGHPCDTKDSAEVAACNEQPCGSVQYCVWSQWSAFGECSATCGSGMQTRTRHLLVTSEKPSKDDDILVTGILDAIGSGFQSIDTTKVEHVGLVFLSGMAMSLGLLGVSYTLVRVSNGRSSRGQANGNSVGVAEETEFATLATHEPFIE